MSNETVIPPVTAGTIESRIDIDYAGTRDRGLLQADSSHSWTFDGSAYYAQTGNDIGAEYPVVPQANGHVLRRETDIRVSEKRDKGYNVFIEERAVRGSHSRSDTFWTAAGSYELQPSFKGEQTLIVSHVHQDRQPYEERESNADVPHYDIPKLEGEHFGSIEEFLYAYHTERFRGGVNAVLQEIIEMDSPSDAEPIDTDTVTVTQTQDTVQAD